VKIDGKGLVFRTPTAWPGRRRLRFLRKGNTVHLLETALVVEGYQQRFGFPVLDYLFRQALSEWTTVTIPYSRILDYQFRTRFWWRAVGVPLLWLPVLLLLLSAVYIDHTPGNLAGLVLGATGLAGALAVITYFLLTEMLAPRNTLIYQQADGKRAILSFSIRSKPKQAAFTRQLEVNREASRARVAQAVDSPDTGETHSYLAYVLLLLFLGGGVVRGLLAWAQYGDSYFPVFLAGLLSNLVLAALALLILIPRNLIARGAAAGLLVLKALWPALWPAPSLKAGSADEAEAILSGAFYVILALVVAFVPLTGSRRKKT
jgi:hypothetical protein